MSKTMVRTGNVTSFTDTEKTDSDTTEMIVPKRVFLDKMKHTRFVIDNCKKDMIQYKSEKETLQLKLTEIEKIAEKQYQIRKDLEKQLKTQNDELMMLKSKHLTKCNNDELYQTDDITLINKQVEDEVKRNLEKNKLKIVDPYLENLYKKFELI